jgi:hypothetical protein
MKLIAESRDAGVAPYVHLGYVAATTFRHDRGLIAIGLTLFLVWCVLVLRVFAGWIGSRIRPATSRPRSLKTVRVFGYGALAAGGLSLLLAIHSGEEYYVHPLRATQAHMEEMRDRFRSEAALPRKPGEYDLRAVMGVQEQARDRIWEDGWRTPMRLRVAKDTPGHVIVSAGPDLRFGTEDDLTSDRLRDGSGW